MTDPIATDDEPGRSDLAAVGLGLIAMALACVPPALFYLAGDDGPRGAWTFADARRWIGLSRFAIASVVGLGPVLGLARLAGLRARRWAATIPAAIATVMAMPMIPGAVIQISWWIAG